MKDELIKPLVEVLKFYADPLNYFGAPAPVYSDSGRRAFDCLMQFGHQFNDRWWNDRQGLNATDIDYLKKRLGERLWDGVIHLGGINTGTWLPWPGIEGNCVREILSMFENREQFRKEQATP